MNGGTEPKRDSRSRTGSIELICGCMFSGKTVELLRRLRAHDPLRVLAFKHRRDNRYSEQEIVTHTHDRHPAITVDAACEIAAHLRGDEKLVGIDEGHFYDEALPDVCRMLAAQGVEVLVTALDPGSWGQAFPVVERLKAIADRVTVMRAVCTRCGQPADRTQRLLPVTEGNIVGGPEAFEPRCAACWHPPEGAAM